MFWNRKLSVEQKKEIRLNVLQLEKLIEKAIDNANNAVIAYDNSLQTDYSSDESQDKIRLQNVLAEGLSAHRFIEQNQQILSQIKPIINNKIIQVPRLIRESLANLQEKHKYVFLDSMVIDRAQDKLESENPAVFLAYILSFERDHRAKLIDVVDSLIDFRELLRQHFSIDAFDYVHESRLDELQKIKDSEVDLSKLIRLCEEVNSAFQNENYLSIALLLRAIIDHVPPIFGYKTFIEVANNYGGKSLKKSLQNLQNSSRNIADVYLHEPIRKKESLPNETQIDFRNDLDILLAEIVRILK